MSDSRTLPPEPSPAHFTDPSADVRRTSGLGIAALIVGGVALLLSFVPFVNYVSGLIALVGVVLGIVALVQKGRKKGLAIAGTIVSVVALILSIVLATVYTAGFITAVDEAVGEGSIVEPLPEPSESESEDVPQDDEDGAEDSVGTRENPAPIGTTVSFSTNGNPEWEITPGAPTLDANALIAAENQFNEPAPAGSQYAILPITITYVGTETGAPSLIEVDFVTAQGTTHGSFDTYVTTPNSILESNELYPGGSATGNVAIAVPSADIANGQWRIGSFLGEEYFFAAQ